MAKQSDIVTITAVDPSGPVVRCRLGDGHVAPTAQFGWQFTKRPRREAFTEFMGYDPYTMVVPLIFGDGADTTNNVEHDLEVLRGMGRGLVGPRVEPAVVRVDCPAIPVTWLKWVINDIQYTTEYRNNDGSRYYAVVSVTFFEWIPTDLVATKAPASIAKKVVSVAKARAATSGVTTSATGVVLGPAVPLVVPSGSSYIVKKGDTLLTIAQKTMGNAKMWTQIAALNGNIRDPKSIKVGQKLRMPADAILHTPLPLPKFTTPVTVVPRTRR